MFLTVHEGRVQRQRAPRESAFGSFVAGPFPVSTAPPASRRRSASGGAMELEELLAPVSEEAPRAPDLANDPERGQLEQAFESSVSIDTSGEASGAGEIDWRP